VIDQLARFKRFPPEAARNQEQGYVGIRFTMDRKGRILTSKVESSSGYRSLDAAALDMLQRAQPLPPPPPDIKGEIIELAMTIQFL